MVDMKTPSLTLACWLLVVGGVDAQEAQDVRGATPAAFVRIEAGEFERGSFEFDEDEEPAHTVHISRPYLISEHEVTVGQFQEFVETTGYQSFSENGAGCYHYADENWKIDLAKSWRDPGFPQTANHPVVCVSWHDAQAYIAWKSRTADRPYRLCTEAQWEYAARGGTTTSYHWGNGTEGICQLANLADRSSELYWKQPCEDEHARSAPVKSFVANPWGLFDMHGNVWEWVADYFGDYPSDRITDPQGPPSGEMRVSRGGGWDSVPRYLRAGNRDKIFAEFTSGNIGFRVCLQL